MVYVDTVNGVDNSSCQLGEIELPCKSLSFASDGRPGALVAELKLTSHQLLGSNEECYPWMFFNDTIGECACGDIPYRSVLCDPTIPQTSILDCYCMTYDSITRKTELGVCFFGCDRIADTLYYGLPANVSDLNSKMCEKYNRGSTLCGQCLPGYSPLVYSYEMDCMNCTGENMTYNWIKYIAVAYIPLTFFFFCVVGFKFSGTSPWMKAFIFLCQSVASPIVARSFLRVARNRMNIFIRLLECVYGIWNLDFFRTIIPPICVSVTPLQALALDYAIAFYPLLLVSVTYILVNMHGRDVRVIVWLWKPFHKLLGSFRNKNFDFEGSLVKAFATFFLLSYLKLIDVSFDFLLYTEMYTFEHSNSSQYSVRYVLYLDASVDYFSKEHLPYAITALFVLIFVIIFLLVFLVIYPMRWFQRVLNKFSIQRQHVDMFVYCYQGYYKDGTNGTRDCRCFSITFFLSQIIMFVLFTLSRNIYSFPICAVFMILIVIVQLLVQPYKEQFRIYNLIDIVIMLNIVLIMVMASASAEASLKAVRFANFSFVLTGMFAVLPFVYLVAVTMWRIWSTNCFKLCVKRVKELGSHWKQHHNIDIEENDTSYNFPDRMENPINYQVQAGLLQEENQRRISYGTAA